MILLVKNKMKNVIIHIFINVIFNEIVIGTSTVSIFQVHWTWLPVGFLLIWLAQHQV